MNSATYCRYVALSLKYLLCYYYKCHDCINRFNLYTYVMDPSHYEQEYVIGIAPEMAVHYVG